MTGPVVWPDAGPVGQMLTLQQVAYELTVPSSQVSGLIRAGDLSAVLPVGRNQQGGWRVERVELEAYIQRVYRRTAQNLASMPIDPPDELTCAVGEGEARPPGVQPCWDADPPRRARRTPSGCRVASASRGDGAPLSGAAGRPAP